MWWLTRDDAEIRDGDAENKADRMCWYNRETRNSARGRGRRSGFEFQTAAASNRGRLPTYISRRFGHFQGSDHDMVCLRHLG